jgi:2-hydroxychromene-2-carboxylate isomerase
MNTLTAWFSIGSTYTFLTALRIKSKIKEENVKIEIYPISIRYIMKNQNNIPFPPEKKSKVEYMWRDIQRRAELYGIPKPSFPVSYPLKNFDMANKVGIVANNEGWYLDYFEETYRQWFLEGKDAGSEENIKSTTKNLGKNYSQVVRNASEESIETTYLNNTKKAVEMGIFGAPSFSVNNDIFWGDDRLEDAITFLKKNF